MTGTLSERAIKVSMFKIWKAVEDGIYDARSIAGDEALSIRDNLYRNEKDFWLEYKEWRDRD